MTVVYLARREHGCMVIDDSMGEAVFANTITNRNMTILATVVVFTVLWTAISVVQTLALRESILDCITAITLTTCQ